MAAIPGTFGEVALTSGKGKKRFSPRARGNANLLRRFIHFRDFWPPESGERKFWVFKKKKNTQLVIIC